MGPELFFPKGGQQMVIILSFKMARLGIFVKHSSKIASEIVDASSVVG